MFTSNECMESCKLVSLKHSLPVALPEEQRALIPAFD